MCLRIPACNALFHNATAGCTTGFFHPHALFYAAQGYGRHFFVDRTIETSRFAQSIIYIEQ